MNMIDPRYRTAVHESSHAILAWAMGGEVEFTTLDDQGGVTSAQVRAENADADWFTYWFAGEAGELAVFRSIQAGDDNHSDGLTASDALAMKQHATEVAHRIGIEETAIMIHNAHNRALRLARAYARDIPLLARELVRAGTLQGDDLNRFRPTPRDLGPMK